MIVFRARYASRYQSILCAAQGYINKLHSGSRLENSSPRRISFDWRKCAVVGQEFTADTRVGQPQRSSVRTPLPDVLSPCTIIFTAIYAAFDRRSQLALGSAGGQAFLEKESRPLFREKICVPFFWGGSHGCVVEESGRAA